MLELSPSLTDLQKLSSSFEKKKFVSEHMITTSWV